MLSLSICYIFYTFIHHFACAFWKSLTVKNCCDRLCLQGQAIRVQVIGFGINQNFPILFAVKQQKSIMSFPVPVYLQGR